MCVCLGGGGVGESSNQKPFCGKDMAVFANNTLQL